MSLEALKSALATIRTVSLDELDDHELGQALRELRACIDSGEVLFSAWAREFQSRGAHLVDGSAGVVSWLSRNCNLSGASAADRVCVGKELGSLPALSQAVEAGEVGYQAAAAVCHLYEQVGDKRDDLDHEALVAHVRRLGVAEVRLLCRHLRHSVDPDGFERGAEEDYERRWLRLSPILDGMYALDGVLDAVGGAAVKAALESLCRPRGEGEDRRRRGQRLADALVELSHHALDSGRLPRRRGTRPHVNLTTTLEGLRGLPGVQAAEVEPGLPIAPRTLERICCDCTISRVVLAGSSVIDVGRATRVIPAATRRALQARDRRCRWPGCDRPIGWTSAHHIEFWSRGGPTRLSNLVSLCHHHHRLVHEGGWQVVRAGETLRFIPPARPVFVPWRARGPGSRQAA